MSDDRNEVRRAHARISELEEQLEGLRARPLTAAMMDRIVILINTWMEAKLQDARPREQVSHLEAKTVRRELLEAFGITEDEMDEARDDSEAVRQHSSE